MAIIKAALKPLRFMVSVIEVFANNKHINLTYPASNPTQDL